jgi:uncharacterized phage protein gp47/JayE
MAIEDLPAIFTESIDDIRTQLLSYLPPGLAAQEGSWAQEIVEMMTIRAVADRDRLNTLLRQTFPATASGIFLDAHADSYGTDRSAGTKATVVIRFTAPNGTGISPGTVVQVPQSDPDADRITYATTNIATQIVSSGYVDVPASAQDVGADFNQPAGAVTLLVTPVTSAVTAITNPVPMIGGTDPEVDDTLRGRLSEQAKNPPGSGNELDYRLWVTELVPGITDVAVTEFWDTAGEPAGSGDPTGSILITARGPDYAPVDWALAQEAQRKLDPSRQVVALMEEGEPWAVESGAAPLTWSTPAEMGAKAMTLTFAGAGTTIVGLDRVMDLSRFASDTEIWLWLTASAWANLSNTSKLRFQVDGSNYYQLTLATTQGAAKPTTGSAWWLWRPQKGSFTATGAPSWSAITRLELELIAVTGAVTAKADRFTIQTNAGNAGEGRAPIGHNVSVVTPVSKALTVAAALTLAAGYTLTGALGTTNITTLLQSRLREFLRTLKPGQPVLWNDIADVLHETPGLANFASLVVGGTATAAGASITVTSSEYAVLGATTFS